MPHLKYRDPTGSDAVVDLVEQEVVVGRLPGCDIVVSEKAVSRKHARIHANAGSWIVTDLQSAHGTFVNRTRIMQKALEDRDEILIGGQVIVYSRAPVPPAEKGARGKPMAGTGTAKKPAASSTAQYYETTGDVPKPGDGTTDPSIVAEAKVGSGTLMKTTISAREMDLAELREGTTAGDDGEEIRPKTSKRKGRTTDGRLLALVRISDGIHRCVDVRSVCSTAVEMAMRATGADRGVLALRDLTSKREFLPMAQLTGTRAGVAPGIVKVSRTFVDRVVNEGVALVAHDTDQDETLSKARSVVSMDIRSILCAPLWDGEEILGYLYLDRIGVGRPFGVKDLDLLSVIGYHAAAAIGRHRLTDRIREEEARRNSLTRFFSADVIRHIEEEGRKGRLDPTLSTAEREVTVLFADIVGFTTISEGLTPTGAKQLLDEYFDRMTEVVVDRNGGTLDKFIGDAIMALFGAPFSRGIGEDAGFAVQAAVEMRDALVKMRSDRPELSKIEIRIGVNTGKVIAGMIGSKRRLEYSVIGDAVNVASRLESTSEPSRIQIGETTYEAVKDKFLCEYAGERPVKNRAQPVKSWWVLRRRK